MKKKFKWLFVAALAIGTATIVACSSDDNKDNPDPVVVDPDNIASANLIAYWSFNDTPNDAKGRVGTATDSVKYVAGKRGKAYQGGNGAYITFPYAAGDNMASVKQYTVAFWVKFAERGGADGILSLSGGEVVTGSDGVASTPSDHWAAGMQIYQDGPADSVQLRTVGNRNSFGLIWGPEGKSPMAVGSAWYHFAVKYDNANSTKSYYLNGKNLGYLAVDSLTQGAGLTPDELLGDLHLYTRADGKANIGVIGYWANNVLGYDVQSWQGSFLGQLDEMRFYNRALTDAEMQALYDAEFEVAD